MKSLARGLFNALKLNVGSSSRSHFTYYPTKPTNGTADVQKMNMFQAINNAMDLALEEDSSALLFGEDVGFGGVFRYISKFNLLTIGFYNNIIICYSIYPYH